MSIQHDISRLNELAASCGGRTYRHLHPETSAERTKRLHDEDCQRLAVRLQIANREARRQPFSPEPYHVLQAEYATASIQEMATRRGLAYQTMYARMKAVGCTFRPQNTRLKP